MNLKKILEWMLESGVDEAVDEKPHDRMLPVNPQKTVEKTAVQAAKPQDPNNPEISVKMAIAVAGKAETIEELDKAVKAFTACGLSKTAAHVLTGIGGIKPKLMCLIDAPRAGDDKAGALLVDDTGVMITKMLAAIGMNVDTDVYIAPISPWRTPGDRPLSDTEMEQCLPFLKRRIELVEPEALLLFGATVSGALIGVPSISKAREKAGEYGEGLPSPIKAFTTFAPAFLISNPAHKKKAWEDLQRVQKYLLGV